MAYQTMEHMVDCFLIVMEWDNALGQELVCQMLETVVVVDFELDHWMFVVVVYVTETVFDCHYPSLRIRLS